MKKIYIILLILITGMTKNYGQETMLYSEVPEIDINVYPDFNNKLLKVVYSSKGKSNLQIKIRDAKGKTIYDGSITERKSEHVKEIYLSKQTKGVYFVEVDSENLNIVERVEFN